MFVDVRCLYACTQGCLLTMLMRAPVCPCVCAGIMTIFECFSWELWLSIFIEVLVVWVCILALESKNNPGIKKGPWYGLERLFDTFFWSFSSIFDPGTHTRVRTVVSNPAHHTHARTRALAHRGIWQDGKHFGRENLHAGSLDLPGYHCCYIYR